MPTYILTSPALSIFDDLESGERNAFDPYEQSNATDRNLWNDYVQEIAHNAKLDMGSLKCWLIENPLHAGYVAAGPLGGEDQLSTDLVFAMRQWDPLLPEHWSVGLFEVSTDCQDTIEPAIARHFNPSKIDGAWPPLHGQDMSAYNAFIAETLLEQAKNCRESALVGSRAILPVGAYTVDSYIPTPWVAMPSDVAYQMIEDRSIA